MENFIKMNNIKNIIFDLGGVLIDWNPDYMYKKIIPDLEYRTWFLNTICTLDWNEKQDGGRTIEEATNELIIQYPDQKQNILAYYERWEEMLNGSIPGTVDIFKILKENKDLKIFALTNWSAETFPRALEIFDFLHWFDGRIVSGEENTRKPHKDIYELIVNRFSLNKDETIFIDDNLRNILAAEEFGIRSIHFKSPELLKSSLEELNLL